MIETRRRRLNPLQAPAAYNLRPRHRHLRMPAEDVGIQQLFRNPLLPGIDDFMPRRCRLELRFVPRLIGIAQYNAHHHQLGTWNLELGTWNLELTLRVCVDKR